MPPRATILEHHWVLKASPFLSNHSDDLDGLLSAPSLTSSRIHKTVLQLIW